MKTPRQQSAFTGAAGVYAVASRLSLMNHTVYIPSVDEGVDIMLGNGLRLQVKCGRYHNDPRTSGRYHILAPGRVKKYHKGSHRDVRRSYAGVVDFVVYWAIEENRFFVFPAGMLTSGVWIPSKLDAFKQMGKKKITFSGPLVREFEEAWHLLDVNAVAKEVVESAEKVLIGE